MKIKKLTSTLLGLMLSISMLAQGNPGVNLLRLGEFDLAKQYFMKAMRQAPAESHYYLGEIAWEEGNMTEAKAKYAEAMTSNPESLYSQIGAAKADLKTDEKEAKKILENIYKKNKKDIPVVLEVAKAFYDNGMTDDGDKAFAEARKSDKTSPLIYIQAGDRMLKQGKLGDAAMQYDQAINFDNSNTLGLIKAGKVYENMNPTVAIGHFKKAMESDPSNRLVNRYLAKTYSSSGRHALAIGTYDEYFKEGNYNLEDLRYYSNSLYFNKDYPKAKEILEEGLKRDPQNFVFHRLMMYTDNELNNYEAGVKIGDIFFQLRSDSGYIEQDFMAYGHLLTESGRQDDALKSYQRAIELNPNNISLYKDLAVSMASNKLNEGAADFMSKYIDAAGDNVEATDYYNLGRYYQAAGVVYAKDSVPELIEKRTGLYKKADAAYETVIERLPDNYLGYFMRGGVNSLLDPDLSQGLAKPYYEKTLEIITANDELEQRKNIVLTAYEYLAVYYYYDFVGTNSADAKTKSLEYCDLYCNINPDKQSINDLKGALAQ